MKKMMTLVGALLLTASMYAQTPQEFNYQAVARTAQGLILPNQQVGMKISILEGSAQGPVVYAETHAASTNAYGLVNLKIGAGSVSVGDFATIDWSTGSFYVQVEMDAQGGTNYAMMGTSKLSSVPYALYAEKAGNVFSGDFNDLSNVPANLDTDATDDFSGSFNDLTDVPANLDTDATDDFSGSFNDLTDVPANLDTDATDDFSGDYNDLANKPTNVSTFTNDAGYLTSEMDADSTNEIQTLSLHGDTIRLSKNGGEVILPSDNGIANPTDKDSLNILMYDGTNWVAKDLRLVVGNTGGNQQVNNMMPYQAVNYCIALVGIFPSRSFEPFIGQIAPFGFNFAPRGWAMCNGQLLPINQNSALFSLLGTTYGGDGRTTFALPSLRGRAPIHFGNGPGLSDRRLGSKGGTEYNVLNVSQLPSHSHTISISYE